MISIDSMTVTVNTSLIDVAASKFTRKLIIAVVNATTSHAFQLTSTSAQADPARMAVPAQTTSTGTIAHVQRRMREVIVTVGTNSGLTQKKRNELKVFNSRKKHGQQLVSAACYG